MIEPTFPDIDAREVVCRRILKSAGALALHGFEQMKAGGRIETKGPQDFVTEHDRLVEEHIRAELADAFPEDGFLGEETGGGESGQAEEHDRWVVDPIDGTANFARGIAHFAVSIAFLSEGRVCLGGIYNPALDELHFARLGRGADLNGGAIRAAATSKLDRACVELGWSTRIAKERYLESLGRLLDLGTNVRRSASGALGLAHVADGRSDAYGELHINAWDCLAGILIAREAGALTNDFLAGDGLLNGNPVLAVTPAIATAISDALGIPLAPPED